MKNRSRSDASIAAIAACGILLFLLTGCNATNKAEPAALPNTEATKAAPRPVINPYPAEGYDAWISTVRGDRVFFAYGSSSLQKGAEVTLDSWIRFLTAKLDFKLLIAGHCDERGTRDYNLALGERRAEAVRRYLIAHGASASRLRTISYGKDRPTVLGSNEEAWTQNRTAVGVPQ